MTDSQDLVKCPLCEGHGEVRRTQLTEWLSELQSRVDSRGSGSIQPVEDTELAPAAVASGPARDFQKDVHSWNPQLPMWRRSPKE